MQTCPLDLLRRRDPRFTSVADVWFAIGVTDRMISVRFDLNHENRFSVFRRETEAESDGRTNIAADSLDAQFEVVSDFFAIERQAHNRRVVVHADQDCAAA
jgi:hypothetical protein